ncbi:MAG: Lrp/AsnC family transcriptional regulator [Rhodobacter sp.]|uniref:Lrp/AsnC family transcriptional regulator n=1 Tax=Pararhodobacter sp. TaxID=2127056 RepID=UPI001D1AC905|nr:Lrp/AsnC family transcriptional regulator [Pararhodobacter sp.]MCB1344554.1 Lrp/AsnC family transcriptional regulator [Paracoccaceae bacterium]MCC0073155.1 Lrp/AsnC family transcriptional regulator [Rhodobacter sp.]HPD91152.1 Lrp/AsnC family transcriptional regulator [Pararhodobacter sp.]
MDDTDLRLIASLKRDGRAGLGELALHLGISRATVRTRLARLIQTGEIAGFTILTRTDLVESPVRALMMVAIEGPGTDRAVARMLALGAVQAVHSTTGRWDVIVDLATDSLTHLDETLARIRKLDGVSQSETHLLMSTRRATAAR